MLAGGVIQPGWQLLMSAAGISDPEKFSSMKTTFQGWLTACASVGKAPDCSALLTAMAASAIARSGVRPNSCVTLRGQRRSIDPRAVESCVCPTDPLMVISSGAAIAGAGTAIGRET